MMAHKQYLLHELMEEAQEPFQLHTYIAERRSQLNKQSNLCFFTPEVRTSPEISSCKSPANCAVFLLRIQKHKQSELPKSPAMKIAGLGFFGSFLKILKDRSRNKKRAMRNDEPKEEDIRETQFCSTPFRFSPCKTPSSSSGHRTPDSCSPVVSPIGHVNKAEKENYTGVKDSVEEEKEQCSPVSVLDPFSEDDDDEHESVDADEDYDLDRSYANIQRARQQLLDRLRRFEKLAELDPMELEKNFLETSDEDDEYEERQTVESAKEETPLSSSLHRKQGVADTSFVNKQVFSQCSTLRKHDNSISHRKITDEIIELDFKRELDGWKCFTEQAAETAADLELAIFGVLVEELCLEEFVLLHG
ncbi:hypothetical protein ACP275_12G151000 [Erythranthe tilingii]